MRFCIRFRVLGLDECGGILGSRAVLYRSDCCVDIVSRNYPYLVAECAGEVVGYVYASPYRLRPAYRHTAENSVYLRPAWSVVVSADS